MNRPASTDSVAASRGSTTRYSWYVVSVLTAIYTVSFIDRQILALLIGPIRKDLGVSDTQVSLLIGLAFALFYTFLGIPLGRLADTRSRRAIIAAGVVIWCCATAACGLAHNYEQLFLARVAVGIGEAALSPAALSLISDYFPEQSRGRAIAFYTMGISLGSGLAMLLGGQLLARTLASAPVTLPIFGQLFVWQPLFFIVGLPGLLLAAVMGSIREPMRRERLRGGRLGGGRLVGETDSSARPSWGEVARFLSRRWRLYGSHFLGMSVAGTLSYGFFAWIPSMFARTWQWSVPKVGAAYGCVVMISGALSIFVVSALARTLAARGCKDIYMRVAWYCVVLAVLGAVSAPLAPNPYVSLFMLFPATVGTLAATAAGLTGLMIVTPNQMRAQASALYYLVVNLVGLTVGPTGIALFTDHVFRNDAMLRYSVLCIAALTGLVAIVLLGYNVRQYRRAYAEAQAWLRPA
jgi:MFS family permease